MNEELRSAIQNFLIKVQQFYLTKGITLGDRELMDNVELKSFVCTDDEICCHVIFENIDYFFHLRNNVWEIK